MRAFEAGFEADLKPIDAAIVETVLWRRIDDLEPQRSLRSSSHFKPTRGGCWRRLAHEDWQTWAMKIEGNSGLSENNAGKQCVIVLTSNLIEVLMIFRCPAHFNRCPHPLAEPRRRLDREGSGCIPGFAGRA